MSCLPNPKKKKNPYFFICIDSIGATVKWSEVDNVRSLASNVENVDAHVNVELAIVHYLPPTDPGQNNENLSPK